MASGFDSLQVSASRKLNIDIKAVRSRFHVELSPKNYGRNDVHVMQHEMKQLALGQLQAFVVMVLTEVEQMSKAAQHALRRTMEKASGNCRLIMCCSNLSQVATSNQTRLNL